MLRVLSLCSYNFIWTSVKISNPDRTCKIYNKAPVFLASLVKLILELNMDTSYDCFGSLILKWLLLFFNVILIDLSCL